MTIARATVAEYLDEQYSSLAAAVDQNADVELGYKPDIDNALRTLGTSESTLATATVEDSSRGAYLALAEYFAARRFWRQLGSRVNTRTGLNTYDFSDSIKAAKEMMDDAKTRCTALGYDVTGTGWAIFDMSTDWLEPEVSTAL
jgi:hypothetical protein